MCDINKCTLCKNNNATQTNSHIVPSFLGARIFSYDGSGKRGKDIAFTLTASKQTVHTGDLPSDKYEELFDEKGLTDERIDELRKDSLSKDYYLCPDCEKNLADYLESPYAISLKDKNNVPGDIGLFFWISVVWRISITKVLGDWLSDETDEQLRNLLYKYLQQKKHNKDTKAIINSSHITYKMLFCPEFLDLDAGFINFKTNKSHNSAAFLCGDIAVFIGEENSVQDFWGLEYYYNEAPINDGTLIERKRIVPLSSFKFAKDALIQTMKEKKMEFERNALCKAWRMQGFKDDMPLELQNEIIYSIHGEGLKLGDRGEIKMWNPIIKKKIEDFFLRNKQILS